MSGTFVAVVGPSGAGKDSVIGRARTMLSADGAVFPRRFITRPAGRGEDHVPVTDAEFARIEDEGGFALSWRAHGLAYGIPAAVADAVRGGDVAVVNVSRGVLDELEVAFGAVVVRVTVSEQVRRARIAGRGRERTADIEARMNRPDPAPGSRVDLEIVNEGSLDDAGRELAEFLSDLLRVKQFSVR